MCTCAIEAVSFIPSNTGAVIATSSVNTHGILMAFIAHITSTFIDIWRNIDEVVETKIMQIRIYELLPHVICIETVTFLPSEGR